MAGSSPAMTGSLASDFMGAPLPRLTKKNAPCFKGAFRFYRHIQAIGL